MGNIQIGGTVYIRVKDCKLVRRPFANDQSYGFLMLQPGTPVQWLGEAPENRTFHKILYQGTIGYTLSQNLSIKPFGEFNDGGCINCKGTGQIETNWGNSQGYIECRLCNGTGGRFSKKAYPSSGQATKG